MDETTSRADYFFFLLLRTVLDLREILKLAATSCEEFSRDLLRKAPALAEDAPALAEDDWPKTALAEDSPAMAKDCRGLERPRPKAPLSKDDALKTAPADDVLCAAARVGDISFARM